MYDLDGPEVREHRAEHYGYHPGDSTEVFPVPQPQAQAPYKTGPPDRKNQRRVSDYDASVEEGYDAGRHGIAYPTRAGEGYGAGPGGYGNGNPGVGRMF
jgi:hypothetical protein